MQEKSDRLSLSFHNPKSKILELYFEIVGGIKITLKEKKIYFNHET